MGQFLNDFAKLHRQQAAKMSPLEVADLRFGLIDLKRLQICLRRRPKHRIASSKRQNKHQYAAGRIVKGIWIDGVRCCRVCKKPLPHKGKEVFRYHMLAVKRRWMQEGARRYWSRVGYDKFWKLSVPARRKRSIERKMAIFRELAPLSSARMTSLEVERLIVRYINPKTGYMHGPIMWAKYVRKNFR